jgi:hypothetical protein
MKFDFSLRLSRSELIVGDLVILRPHLMKVEPGMGISRKHLCGSLVQSACVLSDVLASCLNRLL